MPLYIIVTMSEYPREPPTDSKHYFLDSPTKYDADFYKRKIARLEADSNQLFDQLNKARVRLRRAEDFQLKYQQLQKQNATLLHELDKKEKQICQYRSELEHHRMRVEEKQERNGDWMKEKVDMQREIEKYKFKLEESEEKRIAFVIDLKEKSDVTQKKEMELMKKEFSEREEALLVQIRQVRKNLYEKENVEGVVSNRVDRMKSEKQAENQRYQQTVQKQKKQHAELLRQKDEQIGRLRDKFDKIFNFEFQNLKKSQDEQDQLFSIELNGFREMIGLKNDEIAKLIHALKQESQQSNYEKTELNKQIALLKEAIYKCQRQCELEIVNIKERFAALHGLQIETIQKRLGSMVQGLKKDKKDLQRMLKEREKMVEAEKKETERHRTEMHERLKERDARIEALQERIKMSGDQNESQIKNLHQSFHQIESEKELLASDYQSNVGFLNQQIAKLTGKNEASVTTIKALQEELQKNKQLFRNQLQELEDAWKEDRKNNEEERQRAKQNSEKLQEDSRERMRQWKIRENQLEKSRQKEEREKEKLQFVIEEMERDAERLNNYIKNLDESLKKQMKKNQTSTLDTGGVRRQLGAELERQKTQMEALRRLEIDQIRRKMEIEVSHLTAQKERLQTNLLNKTLAYETLQEEVKKLQDLNKNSDRLNREKFIEYQQKMATLNNQISLTQHLYDNFMKAKAREKREAE